MKETHTMGETDIMKETHTMDNKREKGKITDEHREKLDQ